MIRSLPQGNIPHVAHDDVLRHVRRAVQHYVFVAPPANYSNNFILSFVEKEAGVSKEILLYIPRFNYLNLLSTKLSRVF